MHVQHQMIFMFGGSFGSGSSFPRLVADFLLQPCLVEPIFVPVCASDGRGDYNSDYKSDYKSDDGGYDRENDCDRDHGCDREHGNDYLN